MDVLRKADRRVLWWGLGAWLAICLIGSFWALPGVERSLQSSAADIASLRSADGATIEFNGRDGYLTVPAGTQNAEQIASDIADIRGVRDVEIAVLGATQDSESESESDSDAGSDADADSSATTAAPTTAAPTTAAPTTAVPALTPASFTIEWSDDGVSQQGAAPDTLSAEFESLGVDDPDVDVSVEVGPAVAPALDGLSALIGTDLVAGRATVDGDVVTITGTAPDQAALDRAIDALEGEGVALDLSVEPEVDASTGAQQALDQLLALDAIEFVTNTATPTAETEAIIDEVAITLKEFPEVAIVITGHTDAQGDDVANQALSEARAEAVLDGLIDRGVEADRLQADGKGETEPIDSNDTADGRQRNRRVEVNVEEIG